MKDVLVRDAIMDEFNPPPVSKLGSITKAEKGTPLEQARRLFARAAASRDDVTSRALYGEAHALIEELMTDMVSPEGAFVRKHRPSIKKTLEAMAMARRSLRERVSTAAKMWLTAK